MNRRQYLATSGGTALITSTTGCLGWLPWRDGGDSDGDHNGDSNSDGDDDDPEAGSDGSDDPPASTDNDDGQDDTGSEQDHGQENDGHEGEEEGEEELPEAADPETDTNTTPDDEYATPDEANASQPTPEDVTISNDQLTTDSGGATVTGTLTNERDEPLSVVDVEVQFIEDGTVVLTNLWGTNDLGPDDRWDFAISADGSEFSSVTDYEIAVLL